MVMSEDHVGTYWLMTSPVAPHAHVLRFNMWNHHESRLAKVMWSGWLATIIENEDAGEAVRNPQVQIFHVRSGQFIPDKGTFPDLGFQEGDVFVLLPEGSPPFRDYLEATYRQLPGSLPVDLMAGDAKPLREVLQMIEERQQRSEISIVAGGNVTIGTLLNRIERSQIGIGQSSVQDDLKKAILELREGIARLTEFGKADKR